MFETKDSLASLKHALEILEDQFSDLPEHDAGIDDIQQFAAVLEEVAERMGDNYPYAHPLYVGQMLKPPHPIARTAYMLAMWLNPNNHALDGGRASSAMEKEAVASLAKMLGYEDHLGHLTGGGTMANLEALWVGSKVSPGVVLASEQAHYTHARLTSVLGIDFEALPVDAAGRMDTNALEARLEAGGVGLVVATAGTTGLGSVDPVDRITALRQQYGFRLHVDAAYGGYFTLASNLAEETQQAMSSMGRADSIVIDPHKHGLQPYGCGCVLYADPAVGRLYKHDSPYTYFTSKDLHLGEISLECSRPGAAAVALWATQRLLPMERGGTFAQGLEACRNTALRLVDRLSSGPGWRMGIAPELDIVVWAAAASNASQTTARSWEIFEAAAQRDLHLALLKLPAELCRKWWPDLDFDDDTVTCLRTCLMKPEHEDWIDRIGDILDDLV